MNRRQYLKRHVAAVGLVGALAGCLDAFDDADGGVDLETTESEREADRELRHAVGDVNRALVSLGAVAEELEEPEAAEVDVSDSRESLADASDHLDAALEADDGRQPDADLVQEYAALVERLVAVTDSVTDEELEADIDAIQRAIDDDRLDDARATLTARREALEEDAGDLDAARETIDSIDAARLDELHALDLEEIEPGLDALETVVDALVGLAAAYDSILTGRDHLERGREYLDASDHDGARSAFVDARSAFGATSETLPDEKVVTLGGIEDFVATARCQGWLLFDGADHLVMAASAAASGDVFTVQQRREDAEAAFAAAERCGKE